MSDFESELRATFIEEAQQLLQEAEECFLSLEQTPDDMKLLEKIFRLAHNLKGSAKGVGFSEVGEFTHDFETLILRLKSGQVAVNALVVGLLLQCNDHLTGMINTLAGNHGASFDSRDLVQRIRDAADGRLSAEASKTTAAESAADRGLQLFDETPSTTQPSFEVTEIPSSDSPLFEAESNPHTNGQPEQAAPIESASNLEVAPVRKSTPTAKSDESLRVSLSRLEELINFVGEMVILQSVLTEQVTDLGSLAIRRTVHHLSKVTKEVQELSMGLRMVPIKPLFQKLQRISRDVSAQLSKDVEVTFQGDDVEVDKTVLERIGDPLVHLVRNSLDHGIEARDVREKAGKPGTGKVTVSAYHQSGRLMIDVRDDGAGIDPAKITASAVKKGLIRQNQITNERDALQLIFLSGFSTKSVVTDVSGRGVGMDVVKTNITELGGDVQIESKVGSGTTFRITLPLTLAITDGLLVEAGGQKFVLPQTYVHETINVSMNELSESTGVGTVLMLRGEPVSVVSLAAALRLKSGENAQPLEQTGIISRAGDSPVAILVDKVLGQLQVVVKQLGREVQNLRGIAGSTILGDGMPALIIEVPDLLRTKVQQGARRAA